MYQLSKRRLDAARRMQRKYAPERLERRDLLTLLGVVPSHPLLTWDAGGTTTYTAATDTFFSDGTPLTFQETPVSPIRPVVPPRDIKIDIRVDDSGNLIGGAAGDDLFIQGSINIDGVGPVDVSGTLLTGEIIAFGYEDVGGTDLYDFRFMVTGGALASYFVGKDIGITMVSELSTFSGDWTVDFTGGSKGTVGAIDQLTGSLSGVKWQDQTGDGITGDDTPLGGVTIDLYFDANDNGLNDDGGPVASDVTDVGTGAYSFDDLTAGRYFIVEQVPAGMVQTAPSPDPFYTVIVTAGSSQTGFDFANADEGVFETFGRISGTKWEDLTGNGFSLDDTGLGGTTINLYFDTNNDGMQNDGGPVASTMTAGDGTYEFLDLADGRYFVREVVPTGYIRTGPALTDTYTVVVDSDDHTGLDFANFNKADCLEFLEHLKNVKYTINGTTVVYDLRGNTNQGDLVQVTFTITAGAEPHALTLVSYTAPSGSFVASEASQQEIYDIDTGVFGPGTYTLEVFIPNSFYQIDFVCGEAIDQLGPAGSNIFYTPQMRLISADNDGHKAVLANGSSLSGTVFVDASNYGVHDASESGIGLVKVTLTGTDSQGNSVNLTRYTKSDGSYVFNNLKAGTYTIKEFQPSGYTDGAEILGTAGGSISGNDQFTVSLAASTEGNDYDFGEKTSSGGSGSGSSAASVQVDPFDSSKTVLVVNGTSSSDYITVKLNSSYRYVVTLNGSTIGSFAKTDSAGRTICRIVVKGNAGNDQITVDYSVKIDAWLYGGDGNDKLTGGNGNNVLVGGSGDDYLKGNSYRDLIIAGTGSDTVNGMGGDDLLISGTTAFDSNEWALRAIFAEWNSSRDYTVRMKNIINGSGSSNRLNANYFLNDNTVFDDMKVDYIAGGDGRDWILANKDGYRQDVVQDKSWNETVTDIDP